MVLNPRKLLLLSNSTLPGGNYLEWAKEDLINFLTRSNVQKVTFVPYALKDWDGYSAKVRAALVKMGFEFESVHESDNPCDLAKHAGAFYVGGGNTFQLLNSLYETKLIDVIRKRVLEDGIPYIGASAGTNVATTSICTTNDMPIVYPPSFTALGLVKFNINPHYIDPPTDNKHMGETREERIKQYHEIPDMPPVLGLREGSLLLIEGDTATLRGQPNAKLFHPTKDPVDYQSGSDLSFLL